MRRDAGGRPGSAGMTLIEMLIVITIILVLMALLVSAVASARSRALAVKCSQNLKNIYLATELYSLSCHGNFPRATGGGCDWFEVIQPYIHGEGSAIQAPGRVGIFQCPAAPDQTIDFLVNAFGRGADGPTPKQYFTRPSATILYTEALPDPANAPMGYTDARDETHLPGGSAARIPSDRHLGSINVLYADGHAKSVVDPAHVLSAQDFAEGP